MKKSIFISGSISGDPDFRAKFKRAEQILKKKGFIVMNPAVFPVGFEWHDYMKITLAMLEPCDCIYMLDDWQTSEGALMEYSWAEKMDKEIYFD